MIRQNVIVENLITITLISQSCYKQNIQFQNQKKIES